MAVPSSASACVRAGPPPPRRARASSTSTTGTETAAAFLLCRRHQRRLDGRAGSDLRCRRRLLTARGERPSSPDEEDEDDEEERAAGGYGSFDAAVALFNRGEYHACHDVVEELWYGAEDPARTLLHGVLQCAVGFHHLFNQNHRGAMMELGEGLCKLRKLQLDGDSDGDGDGDGGSPFCRFRDEVAAVLQFLYRTQKELAACTDEMCITMDGSPSSYQLLGNFAAGQQLYRLELEAEEDGACSSILFTVPSRGGGGDGGASQGAPPPHPRQRVKLPTLRATEQHLAALKCTYEYT